MERKMKDYAMLSLKGICMGAADVVPGVSGGTIADKWKLLVFSFAGYWHQHLFVGKADYVAFGRLSDIGMGILFWIGACFYVVRGQRYQGMELENRYGICVGSGNRILHNSSYTCRNAFQSVVYFLMRSDSHLCHDSSGYIR